MSVTVAILHPVGSPGDGPLTLAVAHARQTLAERHLRGFLDAGATDATIISDIEVDRSFGARLRGLANRAGDGGLVVLGSGAIPLATASDRRAFVDAAGSSARRALTNNAYSADVVALACAGAVLRDVPDLATDNMLPRWLSDVAAIPVDERTRWRLGVDIDGPSDLVLLGGRWRSFLAGIDLGPVKAALAGVATAVQDPTAELVITGRVSAANLGWLEARTASRTRAVVEERGLRTRRPGQRPAASLLGMLVDRDGPGSLGAQLARLGDAAIVDTRVLLAHRFGADERGWPAPEDRFASDLLLADGIADPWLRDITRSARDARIPIVLGGHTLVGPGLRLALGAGRRRGAA